MGNRKITKLAFMLTLIFVILAMGCSYQDTGIAETGSKTTGDTAGSEAGELLLNLMEKVVSPPVITSHNQDEEIYWGMENKLVFIEGHTDPGNRIEVYVNGLLKADTIRADGNGYFKATEGIEIVEGKNRIEVRAVSAAGKKSNPTSFNLFLKVPEKVEYSIYNNPQRLKEITDIYFLKEGDPTVYIAGHYQPSADIYVQVNGKIVGQAVADGDGAFDFTDIMLKKGENEIALWGRTEDNLTSQPVFKNLLVTRDSSSPYPSSLAGYSDGFGNHLTWSLSVDENFYSYKLVRVEDPCLNPEYPDHDVIATFSEQGTGSYSDEDVEQGRSYYYTLWTLDSAGNAISSNVLALPPPVYSIAIEKMAPFKDNTVGRRQWYYQYFQVTNTGNVTIDLQPIMVWIKLAPERQEDEQLWPLWEVHIWDADSGQYYYSNTTIEQTYIPDYWAIDEITEEGEIYVYEDGEGNEIEVRDITTKKTYRGEGKRVMVSTTYTVDAQTGEAIEDIQPQTTQTLVEPEKIGSPIEGIEPGQSVKLAVKIQNVSAENGDQITVHFHFAPVDCDGYFFTDEEVSTTDITVISTGRN